MRPVLGLVNDWVVSFTEDTFEFQKARIVGGDEGAEVGVMGGLRGA